MKIGDLVKTRPYIKPTLWGVITKEENRQVECLWDDGEVSWCLKRSVEVEDTAKTKAGQKMSLTPTPL